MQHRLFYDKFKTSQATPTRPNGVPVFFMMPDANVSGPIVKNKTFFFIGYQRLHEKKVAQVDATTPSAEMKGGSSIGRVRTRSLILRQLGSLMALGFAIRSLEMLCRRARVRSSRAKLGLLSILGVAPNRACLLHGHRDPTKQLAVPTNSPKIFLTDYNMRIVHHSNPNNNFTGATRKNRQNGLGRPINIRKTWACSMLRKGRDAPFHQRNVSVGDTWIVRSHAD
jgi:hypothetical protein